jgi:hypothetical protein
MSSSTNLLFLTHPWKACQTLGKAGCKVLARPLALCLALAWATASCIDPFTPPDITGGAGFLVVDGFLEVGAPTSHITLTRTVNLTDQGSGETVNFAEVSVEEENGPTVQGTRTDVPGQYRIDLLAEAGKNYRLHISLILGGSNQRYQSDWVMARETPPIDSLSLVVQNNGLEVQVNTGDPQNNTRFYRWKFVETFQYFSPYPSFFIVSDGRIVNRPIELLNNQCWRTDASSSILIGTSARLSEDVIARRPLLFIPSNSLRLRVRYSILVQQFAMSREEFEYWDLLSKNTEQLGGLFDPLPSQVEGNIRSLNNPEEQVLGYFSAYTVAEKRAFVQRSELPTEWRPLRGFDGCFDNQVDTLTASEILNAPVRDFAILQEIFGELGLTPIGFSVINETCSDCRVLGGTLERPDFW